ncbi:PLP-dependent aminotransferase family protein [Clostridium sp. CX1]|uniref:aminotransferase-like domain-containing protein n=1 Tax=Clostridium sp. CX1 TaxID=2978346 RepID=UPI0021C23A49|nr:PLP-dependent aminotransferase family protein [Clostridium sp. CX1]MCT8977691.1 PLP-dependent aminotransferase family protein [Clostridium sp. CX1]
MYKYLAVSNEIENMIKGGRYKEGEKIPSIRSLTENFNCNKSTVISALHELERRHIVYSLPKSGYYVVTGKPNLNKGEKLIMDFASSAPDPEVFPYLDFQHCINQAIDIYKKDLFVYGTPKGLPSLVDVIHKQLANYQVFTSKRNIFITSGVQQALSILATIPFPNNKETILIEQPSYHLFIDYLQVQGIPVIGIERSSEGIDISELERIFKLESIKFFYTMPRYHNPLGTSYSQGEKKKILELAKKYDVYIVEDDYLADFEQDSKADPIFSYDNFSQVIYLKSYSKIIFPGLRVGVAVIPESLIETFSKYKSVIDIDSSMLSQAALEIYIKSGMFERHREKIKRTYFLRAKLLTSLLKKKIHDSKDNYKYNPLGNICVHTYVELDKYISSEKLINRLKKKSIIVDTADRNYLTSFPAKKSILKINVSNVTEDYIASGITEIIQEIECSPL